MEGEPGGGFGSETNPEARQTAIAAAGGNSRMSLGLPPTLLEALINFLEGKVQ
jgi:hypothetical protein